MRGHVKGKEGGREGRKVGGEGELRLILSKRRCFETTMYGVLFFTLSGVSGLYECFFPFDFFFAFLFIYFFNFIFCWLVVLLNIFLFLS